MFFCWHLGIWVWGDYRSRCWFRGLSWLSVSFVSWLLIPLWIFRECDGWILSFSGLLSWCGGKHLLVLEARGKGGMGKIVLGIYLCTGARRKAPYCFLLQNARGDPENFVWYNRVEKVHGQLLGLLASVASGWAGCVCQGWGMGHSDEVGREGQWVLLCGSHSPWELGLGQQRVGKVFRQPGLHTVKL